MDLLVNELSVIEMVNMCKIINSKNIKELLIECLAQKLTKENFNSMDEELKKEIQEIYRGMYDSKVMTLLTRVFQQNPPGQSLPVTSSSSCSPIHTGDNQQVLDLCLNNSGNKFIVITYIQ